MNSLSWLLYVADTIPSLGKLFGVITGLIVVGCGCLFLLGTISRDVWDSGDRQYEEGRKHQRLALKIAPAAVLTATIALLVPAKETILMIAASEMGETVIKTPEAQEVFTDLKAILKKQLEELKK